MSNKMKSKASLHKTTKELIKQFLEIASVPLAYNEEGKEQFHLLGRNLLKRIAEDLGYAGGEYDVRSNKAGIAVSGEITLHTSNLYVKFSQSVSGERYNILYRSCSHRKDYTGGSNMWMSFGSLKNYESVLDCFKQAQVESVITRIKLIASLNDLCRKTMGIAGRLVQTQGINQLSPDEQSAIREKVEYFSDFTENNDPYGERDFGAFDHNGKRVFWKIDYYASDLIHGSEDPADPAQTVRVLTIMLADEY